MFIILRSQCYCGNNYTRYSNCANAPQNYNVSSTQYTCLGCNYTCPSNMGEMCGGAFALNVYQVGTLIYKNIEIIF